MISMREVIKRLAYELEGVLEDCKEKQPDQTCLQTVNRVCDALFGLAAVKSHEPRLIEAIKLIAYDNGVINRTQPENLLVASVCDKLQAQFSLIRLLEVDAELEAMSEEDFETLCIGEQPGITPPELKNTELVLSFIFDNF